MSGFMDVFTCPKCKARRAIFRQGRSAGKVVQTYCPACGKMAKSTAGRPKQTTDIGVRER